MLSFKSAIVAVAFAFATVARADYVIDPTSVPLSTRKNWCLDEKRTCPLICQQLDPKPVIVNDCDPDALTYGCICGNGQKPNVSEYSLTLPYFTCTEWGNQCVKACGMDNICAQNCREQNPCGAQNPTKPNTTATLTTTTASSTSTSTSTNEVVNFRNSNAADSLQSLEIGRMYGLTVVLGALFAGFAML